MAHSDISSPGGLSKLKWNSILPRAPHLKAWLISDYFQRVLARKSRKTPQLMLFIRHRLPNSFQKTAWIPRFNKTKREALNHKKAFPLSRKADRLEPDVPTVFFSESGSEGLFQLFYIHLFNYRCEGELLDSLHAGIGNCFVSSVFSFESCYAHSLKISGCKYGSSRLLLQVADPKFYFFSAGREIKSGS